MSRRLGWALIVAFLLAFWLAAALAVSAVAGTGCNSRKCEERVARKQCSQPRPVACIRRAALLYRQDFPTLLRVARCESTLNPYAGNGQYVGLFQFGPNAWGRTRYSSRDRTSAKWSSLGAAEFFRAGRQGEWECR